MISPLDVLKGFINLKSYLTWFLLATTVFGLFCFIKNKFSHNQKTTTLKSYLIPFLIILTLFSFLYLSFFHKTEPSSKYTGQLIEKIDKAIKKYDETINNYHGLKKDWEKELQNCEAELKELYEQKELTQKDKYKIKESLNNNETKIKEIKENLNKNDKNITILKGKLIQLEQQKEAKEKEIKQKQEEKNLASPDDKIRLQAEIEKLQSEKQKIIEEISEVEVQIGKLEVSQKYYQDMLSGAEKFKKMLEEQYKDLTEGEKSLYNQIQSVQERHAEIQKEIDEVNKKLEEIKLEKELYQSLKVKYQEMYNRMITYEKENEASAGNIVKWIFKGFDKVTDLIPAKYGLKIIGKSVTFTRKFAQGMSKATLVLHEGHRLWHMYNEVANENKEHPPMITKEALEMYTKDIDRDLAKLDADYKDYEKKLGDYKLRQNKNNLNEELAQSRKTVTKIAREEQSVINEYKTIIKELQEKQKEVSKITPLFNKQNELEYVLSNKEVELNTAKEELKQKNPSYARAQQRLKARRVGKIPEMVMIPNK
ncbi:DNA double-strand break repair Rad50 ATPase [Candidatus Phytoplasma australiense]|uniref:DNA double-strand break repair rad50 ATPase n=1 Tax=Strawberry lethal yellows phytoplasma (CPA) str. NZSb11 TaxID=980422 RepID=R4RW19_PHYAS|nr:DNA double-strand break repair Rad50 ATPase [Candidatus Phytoplasma australiense]AGL90037.1 DNA double-strand break repair rad50 ATPase [Strawberry lethal yellows phytoplasma (CPA) str. NZSb11]AGL90685.1 DNA double-strand break repair rad50 ATPase [Strawberry lethal yellows phytoplasma (CPA) str. NZSb11]